MYNIGQAESLLLAAGYKVAKRTADNQTTLDVYAPKDVIEKQLEEIRLLLPGLYVFAVEESERITIDTRDVNNKPAK